MYIDIRRVCHSIGHNTRLCDIHNYSYFQSAINQTNNDFIFTCWAM